MYFSTSSGSWREPGSHRGSRHQGHVHRFPGGPGQGRRLARADGSRRRQAGSRKGGLGRVGLPHHRSAARHR